MAFSSVWPLRRRLSRRAPDRNPVAFAHTEGAPPGRRRLQSGLVAWVNVTLPRRETANRPRSCIFGPGMSPELLLHKFGYFAVFIGTFLEGETILVMAGFFAERGYLEIFPVALVAASGAYVGHAFWFWLGRTQGVKLLDRFPRMKKHFGRGIRIFERYGAPAI